jgi:uncharacterized protein YceH (UPF0502 family)
MDISLNSHEARVLGVLIEKGYTTPDQYPLSLNAATNGCNQKSNRDPKVDFSEAEVHIAIQGLRMKGLAGGSVLAGSRVEKFRHNAREILKVGERAVAVVAELMLRGPQTAGELRTRAKRMRDIPSLDDLNAVLDELRSAGLVREVSGGRATKYGQLLCAQLHPDGAEGAAQAEAAQTAAAQPSANATASAPAPGLTERVAALESEVTELKAAVSKLMEELGA